MTDEIWQAATLTIRKSVYGSFLYAALITAAPTITFPINSQVPPVARVALPFTFTFSASTFSGTSPLNYKLSNAPSWLSLDGSTRTLSGIAPEDAANTAPIIQITASDNTGAVAMNTTLVVSGNPAPTILIPLEKQLVALGTYSPPSSILYYPSTSFNFSFNPGTFSSSALNYYAVTVNNTPLPAWITFDGVSLSFSGKTPDSSSLLQPPQTWGLQLIASDVLGFAGTAINFNVVVGNHELGFERSFLVVNAKVGTLLNFTSLSGSLYLDREPVKTSDIASANAKVPEWLKFSNSTLSLIGTPPADTKSFNVTVAVVDIHGDVANAIVLVDIASSLFLETIGSINATIGMPFSFDIGSLFSNASDVAFSVQIDPLSPWLFFNSQTLNLTGSVPSNIQPSEIRITMKASSKSSGASATQLFTLVLVSAPDHITPSTKVTSSIASATPTSIPSATMSSAQPFTSKQLSKEEIVAITVPVILFFVAVLLLFVSCNRRRRKLTGRRGGSPNKSDISNPRPPSSSSEEELEAQDRMPCSDAYTNTTLSSKRHTATLKGHSQAMSMLVGRVSMNLRDSRSSGARRRSYSENALSDLESALKHTQDGAYPPLRISLGRYSPARNTRNFSRKTNASLSVTDRSSGIYIGSIVSKRASKVSKSSIQRTPDFAYDPENTKSLRLSRRRASDYLGISGTSRRLSGIGHGSKKIGHGYTTMGENRCSCGFDHGIASQNSRPPSRVLSRDGNSWVTIESTDLREHRRSAMSALTESSEVLNSPRQMTIRQVPKSPNQPTEARIPLSSRSSQPGSKRAVGSSPFFAGSSRAGSQGTSRRSLRSMRNRFLYSSSPHSPGRDVVNDGLEKTIITGLRDAQVGSSDPASNLTQDPLGITYDEPREGIRQLRYYMNRLSRQLSLTFRDSLQFSDSDSRFRSAEHSPHSQRFTALQDQGVDLAHDHYRHSPRGDDSPTSFNRDRYGLDGSPQLAQAEGLQVLIGPRLLSPFAERSSPERQPSPEETVQERYMPSPGRPASHYSNAMVRGQSSAESQYHGNLEDEPDTSIDGVHGAFL